MGENKKYYWLKLKDDFFTQPKMKKLRKIAGGDTYTLIYLKLQLLSLKDEGVIMFEGIEDNFIEELALKIDEDVENIRVTVMFLINQGLMEEVSQEEYALVETMKCIGSETSSASRVRKHRETQKALQCNTQVTKRNTQETNCNTEIEKEIEKDIDIDKKENIKEKPNNKLFESEFELLYEIYPKKQGKANALKSYIKARKEGVAMEDIRQGIQNYLKYITITKKEDKYIKHASTWFNQQCWNDTYGSGKDAEPVYDTTNNPKHTKEEYEELIKMLKKEEVN